MRVRQVLAQLGEQELVVSEHDVVLAAELAEERRPGTARSLGDLFHGCRIEAVPVEQVERNGDDRGPRRRCGGGGVGHAVSLPPQEPARSEPFSAG